MDNETKTQLTMIFGCAVVILLFVVPIILFVHIPANTNISEKGTVVQILENYQGSRLVGKISESYNATELVVQYNWNYSDYNDRLHHTAVLQSPFYVEDLENLYVGATVDITVNPTTGALVTVGGY